MPRPIALIALLMALARHIPEASRTLKAGKWEKKKFNGTEIFGKTLGVIRAPERSTAIGFGDNDMKTLYIAARSSIYRIRTNVVGLR